MDFIEKHARQQQARTAAAASAGFVLHGNVEVLNYRDEFSNVCRCQVG
jgi:hypothetical protein